jgi:molybdopterin-guanine dinucleotide biosynthesis protein A
MTAMALAILAGGASSRMGRDKALLADGRGPLLERLAGLGRARGLPVLVIGHARPAGWRDSAVRFLPDAEPGQGPLGGLATALAHAPLVLLLACDLPRLDDRALGWLLDEIATGPLGDGVVVTHAAGLEPLFAVYAERCRPRLAEALARGERALHRFIAGGDFRLVTAPDWLVAQLANANTPEDWQRLRAQG